MNELRSNQVELRAQTTDDGGWSFDGYAVLWDSPSTVIPSQRGPFREVFRKHAFVLADDVYSTFNHDTALLLGRISAGTLTVTPDDKGLYFCVYPCQTSYSDDLRSLISSGNIWGASFGFNKIEDKWDRVDGELIRTVTQARLFDVSPVTCPTFEDTSVALRSLDTWEKRQPDHWIDWVTLKLKISELS